MPYNPVPYIFQSRSSPIPLAELDSDLAYLSQKSASVKDFGALGNGIADDTAAFQLAMAYILSIGGGTINVPTGTYIISDTIAIPANTIVQGQSGSLIKGAAVFAASNIIFTNVNQTALSYTDTKITIRDLSFEAPVTNPNMCHIYIRMATKVRVLNCNFLEGSDATAFLSCEDTLVFGCVAYNFHNCCYDHWESPKNAKVIACYAEAPTSAQLVNFNPDPTIGVGGNADGFILSDCELVDTGPTAGAIQLEPLDITGTVANVIVSNNIIRNAVLAMRGSTTDVVISDNIFTGFTDTSPAIVASTLHGGTGARFTINGNIIKESDASGGNYAIICLVNGYSICGNVVTDGGSLTGSLTISGFNGHVGANDFAPGTIGGLGITGTTGWPAWIAPTLAGAWVNFGAPWSPVGYYKDSNNIVHIRGMVKDGAGVIFTLPVAYRPSANNDYMFTTSSNNLFAMVKVNTAGEVALVTGSNLSLAINLAFRAD